MAKLDIGLVFGIVALVLAIPLGVAANVLTPRLLASLEKRKLVTQGRNREQELRTYRHIKALREGKKDKYPYYMVLASSSVLCGVISSTLVLLGLPPANEWQQLASHFQWCLQPSPLHFWQSLLRQRGALSSLINTRENWKTDGGQWMSGFKSWTTNHRLMNLSLEGGPVATPTQI